MKMCYLVPPRSTLIPPLTITVCNHTKTMSLTFSQFKIIYNFWRTRPSDIDMPLINCPPEYWYLLSASRAAKFYPIYIPGGKYVRPYREDKPAEMSFDDLSGLIPDFLGSIKIHYFVSRNRPTIVGKKDLPSFSLTSSPFELSKTL